MRDPGQEWLIFVGKPSSVSCAEISNICHLVSQLVEITQDQWDIYKLDPLYNCLVKEPPSLTIISSVSQRPRASPSRQRRVLSLSPESETYTPFNGRSWSHVLDVGSSSEGEVEDMVVDDQIRTQKTRVKSVFGRAKRQQDMTKNRQVRREKLMRRTERLKQPTVPAFDFHPEAPQHTQSSSPETKRKGLRSYPHTILSHSTQIWFSQLPV